MTTAISNLPNAIILNHLLPHLGIKDTIGFGQTNKLHNSLAKTDKVWRQKASDLGLLIHEDAENIYSIVKDILINIHHYTSKVRMHLRIGPLFKTKPTTDENINEIAKRIDLFKSVSIAVFWDHLLSKLSIARRDNRDRMHRSSSRYRSSDGILVYHPLQWSGFALIQKEFDKWLNENKGEVEKIEKLSTRVGYPEFVPYAAFFPSSIDKFINLKVLRLSCSMIFLPDNIRNLSKLEELNLDENRIKSLPNSLGKLKNLKILSLRNNLLKTIFESIGDLQNLLELHIEKNKLRALPDGINNLPNLEEISLGENYIKDFPDIISKKINLKVDGIATQKEILTSKPS
ncbi:MAG: hypothetical protein KR126chlam5_01350 [Candidatus Anoxychlamydiales bacterium]|nr:hypothetical protein [Candidatus Anoxychlamydiales bacterium]